MDNIIVCHGSVELKNDVVKQRENVVRTFFIYITSCIFAMNAGGHTNYKLLYQVIVE